MNINLLDYWDIIIQYTDPIHIISQTAVFTFLFFVIALILVILLRKRILVERSNIILKYLSYIYLFALPIISGFLGFKYGLARAVEKDLISHIDKYSITLENNFKSDTASFFGTLFNGDKKLAQSMPGISTNQTVDVLTFLLYESYGLSLEKTANQNNTIISKAASLFLKVTKSQVISMMVKKTLHDLISEKIGLGDEMSDKLMKTKLNELIDNGIFKQIAIIQIQKVFGGIKNTAILLLIFAYVVVGTEITIAHFLKRKKMNNSSLLNK